MNSMQPYSQPTVIVKRSVFTALVSGFFGVVISLIICGTVLGVVGLYLADTTFVRMVQEVRGGLAEWQNYVPAVVTDMLRDRRAPEYREQIDVRARWVDSEALRDGGDIVLDVENRGDSIVTLLSIRVNVLDGRDVPVRDFVFHVATPFTTEDGSMPGPLQPSSEGVPSRRTLSRSSAGFGKTAKLAIEVTDIRIWRPTEPAATTTASTALPQP